MELFSVVALLHDLPGTDLVRGQVGTIVEVFSPDAFEVEFSDGEGRTYALATLHADELVELHHAPLQRVA
jgi:hypothetical protein